MVLQQNRLAWEPRCIEKGDTPDFTRLAGGRGDAGSIRGSTRARCVPAMWAFPMGPADSHWFGAAVIPLPLMVVPARYETVTAAGQATDQANEQTEGLTSAIDPNGSPCPHGLDSTRRSAGP